ncbi:hypothetical protein [Halopseudomonas laoshanensis]|uniref:hypothetical protein n=1 Tax=Halopseudomonas laoshanensis TaxID=2268758 RepID=UPI003735254A
MTHELTGPERLALHRACETPFPFEVTGFLLDVVIYPEHGIASGRTYRHRQADPVTGRFSDGHQIKTSMIFGFAEHRGYPVLITRNSLYICVGVGTDNLTLMRDLKSLPMPARH